MVRAFRILVSSPRVDVGQYLARSINGLGFVLVVTEPGAEFAAAVERVRPEIAVLDLGSRRVDDVREEIAKLKHTWPEVRIIVVSEQSSTGDAAVIELGVFYYLAGPWDPFLKEVVQAAARSVREALARRLQVMGG